MANVTEIRAALKVLREFYADRDGSPRAMNEVQIAGYLDGLAEFDADELQTASRKWMRESKWWPALSDLRDQLVVKVDTKAMAHLAWTTFERAIRRAGVYQGVTFADPAIGECVRQVFGTWDHACSYDTDSPGWAMRKQSFIELFPTMLKQATESVTMPGLFRQTPLLIEHVEGLPELVPPSVPSLTSGVGELPVSTGGIRSPQLSREEAKMRMRDLRADVKAALQQLRAKRTDA